MINGNYTPISLMNTDTKIPNRKTLERKKPNCFIYNQITVYVKNPINLQKVLELITEFSKFIGNESNMPQSTLYQMQKWKLNKTMKFIVPTNILSAEG